MWKCWVTAVRSFHRQVWGLAWPLWLTLILTFVTVRLLWNTLKPLPLPNTPLFRFTSILECAAFECGSPQRCWNILSAATLFCHVETPLIALTPHDLSLLNRVEKGTKTVATVPENLVGWVKNKTSVTTKRLHHWKTKQWCFERIPSLDNRNNKCETSTLLHAQLTCPSKNPNSGASSFFCGLAELPHC